jgi:hypothetical protein
MCYRPHLPICSIFPHNIKHISVEPRSEFMKRCQRSVDCIHKKYPYKPRQVNVMVSHAAGCVALTKTLTKLDFNEITPAGPCSIFAFTRRSDTEIWEIDAHDKVDGFNGYNKHLSEMGSATKPWNNFGDGTIKFYTGPPTSRFAPKDEVDANEQPKKS